MIGAQLVERLLPPPEVRSSNPVNGNFYKTYIMSAVLKRRKLRIKEACNGLFKKHWLIHFGGLWGQHLSLFSYWGSYKLWQDANVERDWCETVSNVVYKIVFTSWLKSSNKIVPLFAYRVLLAALFAGIKSSDYFCSRFIAAIALARRTKQKREKGPQRRSKSHLKLLLTFGWTPSYTKLFEIRNKVNDVPNFGFFLKRRIQTKGMHNLVCP